MKRIAAVCLVAVALVFGSALRNPVSAQIPAGISFQVFYDELDPYGNWIEYPEYGYVWQPRMGAGFRPYSTGGQWAWTEEYGWTWASDYAWGWAPFHYGRWFHDPYYGWLWMPGYEWSPAWVAWRGGGDYYGWAPLSPQVSIGINFSFGHYSPPVDYWCFVPRQYIVSPRIYNHCLNVQQNTIIVRNTTIINSGRHNRNVFMTGPSRMEVERYTQQRIRPVAFRESSRPGRSQFRRNELTLYRPPVHRDNNRRYAPSRVERFERSRPDSYREGVRSRESGVRSRPDSYREGGWSRNESRQPGRVQEQRPVFRNREEVRGRQPEVRNAQPGAGSRPDSYRDGVRSRESGGWNRNESRQPEVRNREPRQQQERMQQRPEFRNRGNNNSSGRGFEQRGGGSREPGAVNRGGGPGGRKDRKDK